ncbi:MAG TPA: ribosome maturation factor RimP [Tenericutes bacterium]|nr:ribosome maturation factor RimP [Mycoplasmatota bacterium]
MDIKKEVTKLISPILENLGVNLFDVIYEKVGKDTFLRVIIDSEEEIDLDMCVKVTEAIDPILDEADLIPHEYFLEVTTRGIEHDLINEEEINAAIGKYIYVSTYEKIDRKKEFYGYLKKFENNIIYLSDENKEYEIPYENIAKIRLAVKF